MIGIERPDQQIQAMMITTGHLTRPFVENVREAYKIIGLPLPACTLLFPILRSF